MRKNTLIFSLSLIAALTIYCVSSYNSFVKLDQGVRAGQAQIENQYQRRFDLIPNLVSVAKGYMAHEKGVFTEIANARQGYLNAKGEDRLAAIQNMDKAIVHFLALAESYPVLKANETMLSLMDEVAGTENRVSIERMRYNDLVREYNRQIHRLPGLWIAKMTGFKEKPYFEAEKGTNKPPKIEFS